MGCQSEPTTHEVKQTQNGGSPVCHWFIACIAYHNLFKMSFKVLIVTVLAVTLVQAARIHSHQQGDEERDGLKFMSKVAKEVQKDP